MSQLENWSFFVFVPNTTFARAFGLAIFLGEATLEQGGFPWRPRQCAKLMSMHAGTARHGSEASFFPSHIAPCSETGSASPSSQFCTAIVNKQE
jgi:hypothetical protein